MIAAPRIPALGSAALSVPSTPRSPLAPKTPDFATLLDQASSANAADTKLDAASEKRIRDKARASAETLVAQTLIAPLLAQARETNHAAEPFGVTEAEKRLGPVFDERIATQIAHRTNFPIVGQVERSLLKRSGLDAKRSRSEPLHSATPSKDLRA